MDVLANQLRISLGFVRAVVVHHDVDIEIGWDVALDLVEELAELTRTMTRHTFADDRSRLDVDSIGRLTR